MPGRKVGLGEVALGAQFLWVAFQPSAGQSMCSCEVENGLVVEGLSGPVEFLIVRCDAKQLLDHGHHLDRVTQEYIAGWAWDRDDPEAILTVDIYDGADWLLTVPADQFRQDLLDAGKGDGKKSFRVRVPDKIRDGKKHKIRAELTRGGKELNGSPKKLVFERLPAP